jgi:hypothetical protein
MGCDREQRMYQRTARASGVRRVYLLIVHHPGRVITRERRHVCTMDEQRKVPIDRPATPMEICG